MKKIFIILFILGIFSFPAVILAGSPSKINDYVVVQPDEVIEGDFIAAGERIDIHGTVLGDVYVVGGIVNIDGKVEGDVLVGAAELIISGEIGQDLRGLTGESTISGTVQRNITLLSGSSDISRSAQINRNVYIGTGSFFLAGSIDGDLFYASDPDYQITDTASVSGTITRNESEYSMNKAAAKEASDAFNFFGKVISILSTLLVGYFVIRFLPKYADRASELVLNSFWKSALAGFLALIFGPILIVLSFVTLIGFPIGLSLIALFVVYTFVARIYVMIALGKKFEALTKASIRGGYYHFLIGLIVYYLLTMIPVIGGILKFVFVIAGFGAALRNIRNTYYIGIGKKIF